MWELYAFWGWIGPFLVATQIAGGVPTDQAVSTGGTIAAPIILLGVPASWLWGVMADRKGRTFAIMVGSICGAIAEFFLGGLFGYPFATVVIVAAWIGFWVVSDTAIFKAGLLEILWSGNFPGWPWEFSLRLVMGSRSSRQLYSALSCSILTGPWLLPTPPNGRRPLFCPDFQVHSEPTA